ncbi:alpha beta hydrolase fold protein [Colletotrichum karsti]|uniref:Alpha beta hydrolase fold protein n=1 Tax=Colletotrichum karsti TaxID=1095194 RepID=A0A9P6IFB0_9PEZI|nr:alpha beta hydrolase fold protein [Colletotrichum karsti]KAF9877615.1 alpha beta hydrolase fold protein [Colletotrichum karsti]
MANTGMHYAHCGANDGCKLAFQTSLPLTNGGAASATQCVLLMHGFSGSGDYFYRNSPALADRGFWVVAPDMRGHGKSDRTRGGYHVARLAADLHSLVAHLRRAAPNVRIVPVGCSIGAAVLWTYVELFGCADFAGFVFVDQAPLQDRSGFDGWDESKAHTGCYDEKSMLGAQKFWIEESKAAHVDLVDGCLGYRAKPDAKDDVSEEKRREDEEFFTKISALCDQTWLARLLADHTRYDHREAIEMISVPTLVMAGRRSGCFPLEGMLETVKRVEKNRPGLARESVFESGHWLFYEEPERFNKEIGEFVDQCTR